MSAYTYNKGKGLGLGLGLLKIELDNMLILTTAITRTSSELHMASSA